MNLNQLLCNFDWGVAGCSRAAERGEIVAIIDCLSFSTAVVTAVEQGAVIYPCGHATETAALSSSISTELAVKRSQVPELGRFSLSPLTLIQAEVGTGIILPSLNGGSCVEAAVESPCMITGALINARAMAGALTDLMKTTGKSVTMIACGELEESNTGGMELRHAEEDYLSAGAILAELGFEKSPEAKECRRHFIDNKEKIAEIIWDSPSGIWLREKGFGADVEYAARMNRYHCVAIFNHGRFEMWKR